MRTSPAEPLPERLATLAAELTRLVAEFQPSALAVERVLFQANARTAISVGQASGLALVAAANAGVPVAQYSPNEVKLAVTGDGRADKAAVQMMVARLLGLARSAEARRCCRRARARVLSPLAGAAQYDRERGDTVIGSVRGTVIERAASGEVLVEVGGVGYRVARADLARSPTSTPARTPSSSRTCMCARTPWCSTAFRRATSATRSRRSSARPAWARSSRSRSSRCTNRPPCGAALAEDDLDALVLVPGVGKRTAQRLLVELKSRLDVPDLDLGAVPGAPSGARAEVREALTGLGYSGEEVRDVLGQPHRRRRRRVTAARRASRACGCAMRRSS